MKFLLLFFLLSSCSPNYTAIKGTNNWNAGKASDGHPYSKHQKDFHVSGSLNQ